MKHAFALILFFASTAFAAEPFYRTMWMAPDTDAGVWIDGKFEHILFEPAAMRVEVRLQSGTTKMSYAWPANWARNVRFTIKDADGARDVDARLLRQEDEQMRVEGNSVDHYVAAEFQLPPLSHGRYGLTVSYDGLSQSTPGPVIVVRGDETAEIRDWTLQRQIEKAKTWQEVKRLELARVENRPDEPSPWFALAAIAEQYEDYDTTKADYEKGIALTIAKGRDRADETVRRTKRILELLPAYFADREHLMIFRDNLLGPGEPIIELRKRKQSEQPAPAPVQQ